MAVYMHVNTYITHWPLIIHTCTVLLTTALLKSSHSYLKFGINKIYTERISYKIRYKPPQFALIPTILRTSSFEYPATLKSL